jgi:hypothetical protein
MQQSRKLNLRYRTETVVVVCWVSRAAKDCDHLSCCMLQRPNIFGCSTWAGE